MKLLFIKIKNNRKMNTKSLTFFFKISRFKIKLNYEIFESCSLTLMKLGT